MIKIMAKLKQKPTIKKAKYVKKTRLLSKQFKPLFWDDMDGRCGTVKEITKRYEKLRKHAGSDSQQKDILCQRITFLSVTLETMEREAIGGGLFDAGLYVSLINALTGVLRLIGLNKQAKVETLKDYLESKSAG